MEKIIERALDNEYRLGFFQGMVIGGVAVLFGAVMGIRKSMKKLDSAVKEAE